MWIGIALIAIIISFHYINKSGGAELIRNAYNNDPSGSLDVPTVDTVSGIYFCDNKSGCNNKYVLLLKEDQTAQMVSTTDLSPDSPYYDSLSQNDSSNSTNTANDVIQRNSIVAGDNPPAGDNTQSSGAQDNSTSTNIVTDASSTDVTVSPTDTQQSQDTSNQQPVDNTNQIQENIGQVFDASNGTDSLYVKKGTWDFGNGNILIVSITEQGTTTLESPQKFIIKQVRASLLSGISYNKLVYKDMIKPVFIKQN